MLICPNCKQKLNKINNTYQCSNHHTFDISKEGYVNLLLPNMTSSNLSGDNKDMVKSRLLFLNNGHFKKLSDKLIELIKFYIEFPKNILDCGCGEGYYINLLKENFNNANYYGLDISKFAIQQAAKNYKNILFFVSSGANIPLQTDSLDLLINIFAPHFNSEFARTLKLNGFLIKVVPGKNHLKELKLLIYQNPYLNEEKNIELSSFKLVNNVLLEYQDKLEKDDILNLFQMTPYFYKTSESDKAKVYNINSLILTYAFNILIYKKI